MESGDRAHVLFIDWQFVSVVSRLLLVLVSRDQAAMKKQRSNVGLNFCSFVWNVVHRHSITTVLALCRVQRYSCSFLLLRRFY
jgi:hypothetical protein